MNGLLDKHGWTILGTMVLLFTILILGLLCISEHQKIIDQSVNTILFGQNQYTEGYNKAVLLSGPCFDACQTQSGNTKTCLQACLNANIARWVLK